MKNCKKEMEDFVGGALCCSNEKNPRFWFYSFVSNKCIYHVESKCIKIVTKKERSNKNKKREFNAVIKSHNIKKLLSLISL